MNRICLGLPNEPCSRVTAKRRCPACQRRYEALRGSRRATGRYDAAWQKLRDQAIREHPWCSNCGAPGSPSNPLTGDHVIPLEAGGKNVKANVEVLCRGCNSSKGARITQ